MNILIVEDEILIARAIKRICENLPMVNKVDVAFCAKSALEKALSGIYDLFLADIDLKDDCTGGITFCHQLRSLEFYQPILIITSMYSLEYLEQAFSMGVNDYIRKPFHPKELSLRIQRWLKSAPEKSGSKLLYHDLSYDPNLHEFSYQGKKIPLTKREKSLFLLFMRSPEQLLTGEQIKEKFWGDYSDRNRNLRSNIQNLRDALKGSCAEWIRTVRGEGYVLKKDQD